VTVTTGAALAPDEEPDGAEDVESGILVDAGTTAEPAGSFVFVPHVIGGISLTVAPDVTVEGLQSDGATHHGPAADDNALLPSLSASEAPAPEAPAPEAPVSRADRVRAALPFTGPGLTGLGGVVLGCLVVGLGAAGDLALGGGLGVGFTATFLLGCVLVAAALRTRALAVAIVLPPLLFAGGYGLETKTSGQTSGRRQMALDVATSLALHAPVLFLGTALALVAVLIRVIVHLIRR
jgi:hypothetical protein